MTKVVWKKHRKSVGKRNGEVTPIISREWGKLTTHKERERERKTLTGRHQKGQYRNRSLSRTRSKLSDCDRLFLFWKGVKVQTVCRNLTRKLSPVFVTSREKRAERLDFKSGWLTDTIKNWKHWKIRHEGFKTNSLEKWTVTHFFGLHSKHPAKKVQRDRDILNRRHTKKLEMLQPKLGEQVGLPPPPPNDLRLVNLTNVPVPDGVQRVPRLRSEILFSIVPNSAGTSNHGHRNISSQKPKFPTRLKKRSGDILKTRGIARLARKQWLILMIWNPPPRSWKENRDILILNADKGNATMWVPGKVTVDVAKRIDLQST
jgi:hypothetical protein